MEWLRPKCSSLKSCSKNVTLLSANSVPNVTVVEDKSSGIKIAQYCVGTGTRRDIGDRAAESDKNNRKNSRSASKSAGKNDSHNISGKGDGEDEMEGSGTDLNEDYIDIETSDRIETESTDNNYCITDDRKDKR